MLFTTLYNISLQPVIFICYSPWTIWVYNMLMSHTTYLVTCYITGYIPHVLCYIIKVVYNIKCIYTTHPNHRDDSELYVVSWCYCASAFPALVRLAPGVMFWHFWKFSNCNPITWLARIPTYSELKWDIPTFVLIPFQAGFSSWDIFPIRRFPRTRNVR